MQEVISFLRQLRENNNREWFLDHRPEYLQAKGVFSDFAMTLADRIRGFDDTIGPLQIQDMTWRINRDIRFSANKNPYKCHMGVFVCRGGKKSGYGGYYFQVSAADDGGWESSHMAAVGNYFMESGVLKILREDILYGNGDFRRILSGIDPRLVLETGNSLKRVPAPFPQDSADSEYFKLKNFSLSYAPDESFVLKPDLPDALAELFKTAKPFLDYTNRALDYLREQ